MRRLLVPGVPGAQVSIQQYRKRHLLRPEHRRFTYENPLPGVRDHLTRDSQDTRARKPGSKAQSTAFANIKEFRPP